MPMKPEVTTSPFGASLILIAIVIIVLGLLVLPIGVMALIGALYVALAVVGVMVLFYAGKRFNRWALGKSGGGR